MNHTYFFPRICFHIFSDKMPVPMTPAVEQEVKKLFDSEFMLGNARAGL